jgi:hypothetical protein
MGPPESWRGYGRRKEREMPFLKPRQLVSQPPERDWWPPGDPAEPEILLRQIGPNTFQLMEGFRYTMPKGQVPADYEVPQHNFSLPPNDGDNSTDLASVPQWFWWFIASYGRHTRPALLHDFLVDQPSIVGRRQADHVFRVALKESEVGFVHRWLMWTAVSFATWLKTGWLRAALALFVLYFLAFAGSIGYWFSGGEWSWLTDWSWLESHSWAPALGIGLAGFLWGQRWPFTLLAVVLLLAPTVYAVVVTRLVGVVDYGFARLGWILSPEQPFVGPQIGAKPHQVRPF